MSTGDTAELLEDVPEWWAEPVFGLAVVVAGLAGVSLATLVAGRVGALLGGWLGPEPGVVVAAGAYAATLALLSVLSAAVGLGVTRTYLRARGFEPGFVVAWPDREAVRWLAALAALGPALVWGLTLASGLLGNAGPDGTWEVPSAYLAAQSLGAVAAPRSLPLAVGAALSIAVLALVVGPVVGALVHGVLQSSLRRVAPATVAVGGTALAAGVLANGVDPLGTAVVAVVAAGAGVAYDRTGNLAVPMAAYAVLNAVTMTTALVLILRAAGQL